MGYFAVLTTPDGALFTPTLCHINLWALAGACPGRRLWYIDVGLKIQAGPEPVDNFQFLLPVDIEDRGHSDLFDALSSQDVLELVFGGQVDLRTERANNTQHLNGTDVDLQCTRADIPKIVREDGLDRHSSLVTVPLQQHVPAGESRYVRLRFRVFGMGPTWRWRGPLMARTGGRLDLRVNDVRESRSAVAERTLRDRVLAIDSLYVFVMLPKWLRAGLANPDLSYVRALESGAWSDYLKEAPHLGPADRLVVHYWKHTTKPQQHVQAGPGPAGQDSATRHRPVTKDHPFRGFLDLERPTGAYGWWFYVRTALAVLLAMLVAGPGLDLARDIDMPSPSLSWYQVTVGGSAFAAIAVIALFTKLFQTRGRWLRLRVREVERWVLRRIGND